MKANAPGQAKKSTRQQPDSGNHFARLLSIVDFGHQPAFQGQGWEKKDRYEFELTYELVDLKMEDGRPFVISETIPRNAFFDTKSGKCSTLVARARSFLGADFEQGLQDVKLFIGKACMVSVVPKPSNADARKIDGQAGVGSCPASVSPAELHNAPFVFDLENPDMDIWETFLDWKKERIQEALNYNETALAKNLAEEGEF